MYKTGVQLIELIDICRGLTSSSPFEDTIYIDSVPVIGYKSGTDGILYSVR